MARRRSRRAWVIPRNALQGLPMHKVDLRVTKDVKIFGTVKGSLIAEIYNLFDRANYGSYNTTLSATNAAQTAVFGQPVQNLGNAYVPREGQLAFRISFLMRRLAGLLAVLAAVSAAAAPTTSCPIDARQRRPRRVSDRSGARGARAVRIRGENRHAVAAAARPQQEDPVAFLGKLGVKPAEVLQDVKDLWAARAAKPQAERGGGGHILTGPIYVEGAEPGDTLAVEMIEVTTRVPYGINSTSSTSGVFSATYPGALGDPIPVMEIPNTNHLIRTGVENGRAVAFFADNIRVPMNPFFGTMAVAPEHPKVGDPGVRVDGLQTSGPPGAYGGNMDFRDLKTGSTLYLPVFHPGALFYVGDPHGTQGDGEVSGNAIEQSLTGVLRFTVLKGKTLKGPRAEDAAHYFVMGIDLDLDRAMRKAVAEAVDFLVKEKGMAPAKALSLCSIAIDFRIAEVVDTTQVVVGRHSEVAVPLARHCSREELHGREVGGSRDPVPAAGREASRGRLRPPSSNRDSPLPSSRRSSADPA